MVLLVVGLFGCDKSNDPDDPCVDTIAPQISVELHYTLLSFYEDHAGTLVPLNERIMKFNVFKSLCEGTPKGSMELTDCRTQSDNSYNVGVVYKYNLHNTKDRIVVNVQFPSPGYFDNGNGIQLPYADGWGFDAITYNDVKNAPGGVITKTISVVSRPR